MTRATRPTFRCSTSLSGAAQIGAALWGLGVAVAIASRSIPPIAIVLGALPLALGALGLLLPVKLEVANDGIVVRRFGRSRFIPYRAIESVTQVQRQGGGVRGPQGTSAAWTVHTLVRFTLAGGGTLDLGTGSAEVPLAGVQFVGNEGDFGAPDPVGREIVSLVRARLRARAARPESIVEADLARGARGPSDWAQGIAALARAVEGGGAGGYRGGGVSSEALWEVLEDGEADVTARAAAAVVLRGRGEAPEGDRIRIALSGCASPRLRVALEKVLEPDDGTDDQARIQRILGPLDH